VKRKMFRILEDAEHRVPRLRLENEPARAKASFVFVGLRSEQMMLAMRSSIIGVWQC
jgi:hypothetical protein